MAPTCDLGATSVWLSVVIAVEHTVPTLLRVSLGISVVLKTKNLTVWGKERLT
jgi:hypothetical protein